MGEGVDKKVQREGVENTGPLGSCSLLCVFVFEGAMLPIVFLVKLSAIPNSPVHCARRLGLSCSLRPIPEMGVRRTGGEGKEKQMAYGILFPGLTLHSKKTKRTKGRGINDP